MSIFDKKPYITKSVGEYRFDFYYKEGVLKDTYLKITTTSGIWELKIAGNTHTYGYLLSAAMQGNDEYLHGFAVSNVIVANLMCEDNAFKQDLDRIINKRTRRLMREGASRAKSVTPEQEQADMALMGDVAAFADSNDKERKQMRKQWKEDAREALKEENNPK